MKLNLVIKAVTTNGETHTFPIRGLGQTIKVFSQFKSAGAYLGFAHRPPITLPQEKSRCTN